MSAASDRAASPGRGRRVWTALPLILLALGGVTLGGRAYVALITAMSVFLIFEWTRIVDGAELRRGFFALSGTAAAACYLMAGGEPEAALLTMLIGGLFATALEWPRPNAQSWPAVGAVYIVLPAIAALWLRLDAEDGFRLTLLLFFGVWAADSGALLAGRTIGGPKLAPKVSPAKTWAGAAGAVLASTAAAAALAVLLGDGAAAHLLYGLVIGVAAVLGDLAESALKRRYGMKDSGGAFPGHGGVLDRLDSFLFAALALAGCVLLRQA